jgi:hypothetical protein
MKFHDLADDEAKAAWDNIVDNGHGFAHQSDATTTQIVST